MASSIDGTGVYGNANASTGENIGVWGRSQSTSGRGVYGQATALSGLTYGVYGESSSPAGYAVYGRNLSTSGGDGAYFESSAPGAYGVFGVSQSNTGSGIGVRGRTDGDSGIGVYGYSLQATGTMYGVNGSVNSASGWAIYATGRFGASGAKSFRIDHPQDPENKYLLHFAAESPEVVNFYRGVVTLDGNGEAIVELPGYFALVNRAPSYTLTAVGAPMPMLHIAEKISEQALAQGAQVKPGEAAPVCTFRIAGGVPGGEVSWRVEAERNDAWMRVYRPNVIEEKTGAEKGTYQHPELFGQPAEKGDPKIRRRDEGNTPTAPPPPAPRQKPASSRSGSPAPTYSPPAS